jgi:hypothetical protein
LLATFYTLSFLDYIHEATATHLTHATHRAHFFFQVEVEDRFFTVEAVLFDVNGRRTNVAAKTSFFTRRALGVCALMLAFLEICFLENFFPRAGCVRIDVGFLGKKFFFQKTGRWAHPARRALGVCALMLAFFPSN